MAWRPPRLSSAYEPYGLSWAGYQPGRPVGEFAGCTGRFTPLQTALAPSVRLLQASPIYETEPWGFLDQPAFLNQALQAETDLPPLDLLAYLKDLETQLGRMPNFRYGPRLIDIDILLYDDLVLSLPGLEIPHPRLAERAFVLVPLVDLAPDLRYPGNGHTIEELLEQTGRAGVRLFSPT